jgi:hypothetical protein
LAKKSDNLADFEADDAGGVLGGLLAEENELDSRTLWRIASWGVGATGAVILAVMANQSSIGIKRDQVAAADLTRQAQQIQLFARETQNEARRLAAAIDTLNNDRDRLYTRVTGLEHGLDSVTGTIAKQSSAATAPPPEPQAAPRPPQPSPVVAPVASAPAAASTADKSAGTPSEPAPVYSAAKDAAKTDAVRSDAPKADGAREALKETAKAEAVKPEAKAETTKGESAKIATLKPEPEKPLPATPPAVALSVVTPPDPAAGKLVESGKAPGSVIASPIPDIVASAPAAGDAEAEDDGAPKASLRRTEFGVDLGTANSVNGLRMLWLGLLKSRSNAPLTALRPIIVIKEATNGLGMQLRLVAGPLNDAGAAARICAIMAENKRACETTIFDGQRLSLKPDDAPPAAARPAPRHRGVAKRAAVVEEAAKQPEPPPATLSSFFNRKNAQ